MSDNLIKTGELSSAVLRDVFVLPLRSEGADNSTPLKDPQDGNRVNAAPLVLTSFPDTGLLYPHIIVERANDSSRSLDWNSDVNEHRLDVRITAHSESATTANKLVDGVIHWAERERHTMSQKGFMEAEVGSAQNADWESDPGVSSVQIVISGLVNTSPNA